MEDYYCHVFQTSTSVSQIKNIFQNMLFASNQFVNCRSKPRKSCSPSARRTSWPIKWPSESRSPARAKPPETTTKLQSVPAQIPLRVATSRSRLRHRRGATWNSTDTPWKWSRWLCPWLRNPFASPKGLPRKWTLVIPTHNRNCTNGC